MFASRDRFGVKPLIYYFDGKRFAFASEMKAFLGLNGFRAEFLQMCWLIHCKMLHS
ncbi:MAG: hypothetical protein HC797_06680 [Anaerolineales bacterium]|nr:hypothetical protein [Anaerolineales bacterium]